MEEIKLRESIISEYLTATVSLRKLAVKYGIKHQTLHNWVMQYQGRMKKSITKKIVKPHPDLVEQAPLPTDVKELQS